MRAFWSIFLVLGVFSFSAQAAKFESYTCQGELKVDPDLFDQNVTIQLKVIALEPTAQDDHTASLWSKIEFLDGTVISDASVKGYLHDHTQNKMQNDQLYVYSFSREAKSQAKGYKAVFSKSSLTGYTIYHDEGSDLNALDCTLSLK